MGILNSSHRPSPEEKIASVLVEDALNQGCEIVDIEGNEKLIRAGSIGAVLRYKL
ncbi:unnamed protein product [marine sediment metagenome]|uniref:eRF1 domain-containing protein n=1 Tax=marine sediment metagenome TaxID=412755 RepID=X1KI09_9ZZZZ